MPRSIPSGPPLSSRAILLVGGMALFCLSLSIAFVFEVAGRSGNPPIHLDLPPGQASEHGSTGNENPPGDRHSAEGELATTPSARFTAESHPISAGTITMLERASEEEIEVELERLLEAIQQGFGETSIHIEPTLRPYAYRLAGRMNIRPGAFRVRVAAPSMELAVARTEVLSRLFEAAGVVSSRLTFVPRTGIHSLTVEPA